MLIENILQFYIHEYSNACLKYITNIAIDQFSYPWCPHEFDDSFYTFLLNIERIFAEYREERSGRKEKRGAEEKRREELNIKREHCRSLWIKE